MFKKKLENIKIFYAGIDILKYSNNLTKGFTTNPTLMNKGNIQTNNYKDFALSVIQQSNNLPISFEVFADTHEEMIKEAKIINSWADNIYVKIPIINSAGISNSYVIKELNKLNIKINITAIFTKEQIKIAFESLVNKDTPSIISIFCGRISDTGINCKEYITYAKKLTIKYPNIEILWASVREVYNIIEAIESNCDIITLPNSIYDKLDYLDKNLNDFSIETSLQFYNDGIKSNIKILE